MIISGAAYETRMKISQKKKNAFVLLETMVMEVFASYI